VSRSATEQRRRTTLALVTRTAATIAIVIGCAPMAAAQARGPRVERIVVSAGIGAAGGAALAATDATLRAGAGRQPLVLFRSESRLGAAPEVHVRLGALLTPRVEVDGGLMASRPELRVEVSGDTEGAPAFTAVEVVEQVGVDVGARAFLGARVTGRRIIPFGTAGVGYLRQRHEGRALVNEGLFYRVGGGLTYWLLERPGVVRSLGLRVDGGVRLIQDDLDDRDDWRRHTVVSAVWVVGF
jgi:hypothetical protein